MPCLTWMCFDFVSALQVGLAFGDWILGTVEGIATSEVSGSLYFVC